MDLEKIVVNSFKCVGAGVLVGLLSLGPIVGCTKDQPRDRGSAVEKLEGYFNSPKGGYTIHLNVLPSPANSSGKAEMDTIEKNSAQDKWTYEPDTEVGDVFEGGDVFNKMYNGHLMQVLVKWTPSIHNVKKEFNKIKNNLQSKGFWVDKSESEIVIDGHIGMAGDYSVTFLKALKGATYNTTLVLINSTDRFYMIDFSTVEGYPDRKSLFEGCIGKIKFFKKKG